MMSPGRSRQRRKIAIEIATSVAMSDAKRWTRNRNTRKAAAGLPRQPRRRVRPSGAPALPLQPRRPQAGVEVGERDVHVLQPRVHDLELLDGEERHLDELRQQTVLQPLVDRDA